MNFWLNVVDAPASAACIRGIMQLIDEDDLDIQVTSLIFSKYRYPNPRQSQNETNDP